MDSDTFFYKLSKQVTLRFKQKSGRWITIAGITGGLLIGFPIMYDVWQSSKRVESDRAIELIHSKIVGYTSGRKNWVIISPYIESDAAQTVYTAASIADGMIFNSNEDVVIRQIQSQKVRVNSRIKTVLATGGVSAEIIPKSHQGFGQSVGSPHRIYADDGKGDAKQNNQRRTTDNDGFIKVSADTMRHTASTHKTVLSDNVRLLHDDAVIYPNSVVEIDTETNIATIKDGAKLVVNGFDITAKSMVIHIDDQRAYLTGIMATRTPTPPDPDLDPREQSLKSQETTVHADTMVYEKKGSYMHLQLSGNVRMAQQDKTLQADAAVYDEKNGEYRVSGHVKLVLAQLEWVVQSSKKSGFDNPHLRTTLTQHTTISCDALQFSRKTKRLDLEGSVSVLQSNQSIQARKISLDDEKNTLKFFSPLKIERAGSETFSAQYLEVNLLTEDIFAKSNIFTEFFL